MKLYITLALLLCSSRALAYDSEAVCLAQCMINEADTEAIIDHLAIAAILDKRADKLNISMCQMVHRYCGGLRPRDRKSPRHKWILGLNAHGRRPRRWPYSNGPWSRYVDRWFQVLIVADLFLQETHTILAAAGRRTGAATWTCHIKASSRSTAVTRSTISTR